MLRSVLVHEAAHRRLVITGHDNPDVDSIVSCVLMQRLLAAWGIHAQIVLHTPADRQSRRVMAKFGVDAAALEGDTHIEDVLILVDHHQSEHPGRIVACIDHHPTDYPPAYPFVLIEDCGACAVTVLRLMREADVRVTEEDESLAISALYLDTIALKSTKISKEEAAWGEAEAKRLGLDEEWLRREGMGLRDMTLPNRELALLGKKIYSFGGKRVLSTYIQTDAMTPVRLNAILSILHSEMAAEYADLWVYLVHDPMRMRSMEYDLTPDGQIKTIQYDYLASRGKDVMPRIERELRKEEAECRDFRRN